MTPASSSGRIERLTVCRSILTCTELVNHCSLLHGFSGCSQDWFAFIKMQSELGECEFQLIIPDMRGHGRPFATEELDSSRAKSAQPGLAVPQGGKGQHGTIKGPITARTLIVQGDRDPLYPVEISVQMAKAIPRSDLWILPGAGHGPVLGERWTEFLKTAAAFLRG